MHVSGALQKKEIPVSKKLPTGIIAWEVCLI